MGVVTGLVAALLFVESWAGVRSATWEDGADVGRWHVQYTGYGQVRVDDDGGYVLTEQPRSATRPGETHAALVTTRRQFHDFDMSVRVRTVAQLRTGSRPNPWEAAWVLWHYTDDEHFYSLVLKPNGWELGKEDPAYPGAQRYLRTGSNPRFPVGRWHPIHVRQVGATISVAVDGVSLAQITDRQRPYRSGAVGLYTEDAAVHWGRVAIGAP